MSDDALVNAPWKKSSYSGNTGNCVEVAITESVVGIRDSKDPEGPTLVIGVEDWQEFVSHIKDGRVARV